MLLDEKERLQEENVELRNYQEKYYEADKKVAVLEEERNGKDKLVDAISKKEVSQDITFGVCLTIGATMVGPPPWEVIDWPTIIMGVILIVSGVLHKWWR